MINRIAIVTGANKGIGFHVALQLAKSGLFASLILACRDPMRGHIALEQIQSQCNNECKLSCIDLTLGNWSSHEAFVKEITTKFGRVDVLVNNAAIAFKASDQTPHDEQAKPTLDVNFRGTLDLTTRLIPLLRNGDDPRVVNVASMAGRLSQVRSTELRQKLSSPELTMSELCDLVDQYERDVIDGSFHDKGWGGSNYGMSKLALIAATKVLARNEKGNGILVNCCCPGYCDTDMSSHTGPRPPSEGAKNAVLLATTKEFFSGEFIQNMKVSAW